MAGTSRRRPTATVDRGRTDAGRLTQRMRFESPKPFGKSEQTPASYRFLRATASERGCARPPPTARLAGVARYRDLGAVRHCPPRESKPRENAHRLPRERVPPIEGAAETGRTQLRENGPPPPPPQGTDDGTNEPLASFNYLGAHEARGSAGAPPDGGQPRASAIPRGDSYDQV